jgi:hypothetical protein
MAVPLIIMIINFCIPMQPDKSSNINSLPCAVSYNRPVVFYGSPQPIHLPVLRHAWARRYAALILYSFHAYGVFGARLELLEHVFQCCHLIQC